jgi:hypothetical protein
MHAWEAAGFEVEKAQAEAPKKSESVKKTEAPHKS